MREVRMAENYLPILILMRFASGIAGAMILLSAVLGPRLRTRRKLDTYESGMPLLDPSRKRVSIQFFLIAMVFILFDVEIAFLYPWALVFRSGGAPLFGEMVVFLVVLGVGYAYLWKNRAFDW
jgi:NADH:ubiquinone oxidoreductase subunit 3 (subunit A)